MRQRNHWSAQKPRTAAAIRDQSLLRSSPAPGAREQRPDEEDVQVVVRRIEIDRDHQAPDHRCVGEPQSSARYDAEQGVQQHAGDRDPASVFHGLRGQRSPLLRVLASSAEVVPEVVGLVAHRRDDPDMIHIGLVGVHRYLLGPRAPRAFDTEPTGRQASENHDYDEDPGADLGQRKQLHKRAGVVPACSASSDGGKQSPSDRCSQEHERKHGKRANHGAPAEE